MTRIFLAWIALTIPAFSAVIHFDSLTNGEVITNQFAGVLFSSTAGSENKVTTQPQYNGTPPNFLCTGPVGGGIDCAQETILDFTGGVKSLTFQAMGVNDVSPNVAQVDVFIGGLFNSTITIAGNSEFLDPLLVDLSAFSNVTRIRIHSITDGGGIGWDTFTYQPNSSGEIPEPSTFVLLGAGLAMAFRARRR